MENAMVDVTLAEFDGSVWLVGGEAHIDNLLANTLAPDITIEMVTCETKMQVHALWHRLCGPPEFEGDPWLIHPGIVNRIRGTLGGFQLRFAPWSAQLNAAAQSAIAAAAAQAGMAPLLLTDYGDANAPDMEADLARLRLGLIERALIGAGIDATRLRRARQPVGQEGDAERVDIEVLKEA
jgi:hypothetical protein